MASLLKLSNTLLIGVVILLMLLSQGGTARHLQKTCRRRSRVVEITPLRRGCEPAYVNMRMCVGLCQSTDLVNPTKIYTRVANCSCCKSLETEFNKEKSRVVKFNCTSDSGEHYIDRQRVYFPIVKRCGCAGCD